MRLRLPSILFAVLLAACSAAGTPAPSAPPPPVSSVAPSVSPAPSNPPTTLPIPELSDEAEAYLAEAIELMRTWSISRDLVDWDELTELAMRRADGAATPQDTYPAIEIVLGELRDGHSVFLTPGEARTFDTGTASFDEPLVEVRGDGIGYVSVGRYLGNVGDQADAYAADLAGGLADALPETCGWLVDLRANTGGNMWPMIAGLAPLLGEGRVGAFTYPDGMTEPWRIADGTAWWDELPMTEFAVPLPAELPPVAVLISPQTASSGEATTVAFVGRADTRLFGQDTAGLTTSNEPLFLSDGAMLALTMSVFTDRTGHAYGQGVSITPGHPTNGDPTDAAISWLLEQPVCSG